MGVCLYAMVSGKKPFDLQNRNKELLIQQIENLDYCFLTLHEMTPFNPKEAVNLRNSLNANQKGSNKTLNTRVDIFMNKSVGSVPTKCFSNDLQVLLKGMLCADPNQRLTLDQIIASSWFRNECQPIKGLQSIIDIRKFTDQESLKFLSRKNLFKPNLSVVHSLKNYGYVPDKVVTELRRGRLTDGAAAYMILNCVMPHTETREYPESEVKTLRPKKLSHGPLITIPTSVCAKQQSSHRMFNEKAHQRYARIPKSYRSRISPFS